MYKALVSRDGRDEGREAKRRRERRKKRADERRGRERRRNWLREQIYYQVSQSSKSLSVQGSRKGGGSLRKEHLFNIFKTNDE